MKPTAKTINGYLAKLSRDKRAALQKLRRAIRAAVPNAEERISYGVPAFRLEQRFLVAFGVGTNHCSFYPGAFPIAAHKRALKGYDTSKGTIRFPADKPLPAALVRILVRSRIAEQMRRRGQ
jgi:uncharacterized protein YdhG (YjbR/CyaY superfamily)